MTSNGRVHSISPAPSEHEAAAAVAAIERFLREHAVVAAPPEPAGNPWQRAALLEGTGRLPDDPSPWGDPVPWG